VEREIYYDQEGDDAADDNSNALGRHFHLSVRLRCRRTSGATPA
jgi:hypothetical protein